MRSFFISVNIKHQTLHKFVFVKTKKLQDFNKLFRDSHLLL